MAYGPPPGPPPAQNGSGYPQPPVNSYNPYGNGMSADQSYVNSQPAPAQYEPPAQYAPPKDEWTQQQQQQQQQYGSQPQYNGNGYGGSGQYAMNQSQPYAEQAPPPQAYGSQENFGSKPSEGERFKPKKVRDKQILFAEVCL